jgi:hypothetical protein
LASFEVSCSYNNSRGTTSKSFSLHHLDLWDLSWLEFLDFYKLLQLLRLFIVRFSFSILFSSFVFFFFLDLWHLGFGFFFFKSLSECAVGAAFCVFSIMLLGSFVIFVIPFSW